ncbi:MAG: DNA primase, partial [Dehalococcoidia bacterium]|nr:DNA primase [Dehalococcoidia bacterium]
MSVTDEIKERVDIVDMISQQVTLKRSGKTFKGNCPFHVEKTPSFYVYPDGWSYHCFGCGAHGNGFDFVMATQNMSFAEALTSLAQKAGIALPERRVDEVQDKEKKKLREIQESAAQYYHNLLVNSPAGQVAYAYVEKRGLQRETVEAFQLGYCLNNWDAMKNYLSSKGYTLDEMVSAGLLVKREDGSAFDRFRHRLLFPIRDRSGEITGFGGRALDDNPPKYMNSPETLLFDKSSTLYAIDKAATAIRTSDQAVIVEGYMDAVMAHQHGYRNVVASMGTALTEKQMRILKRLSKNLVLALDPDSAGDEATLRGLAVAQDAFDQKTVAVPTWQGIVRYEHRLDAYIKIATLPRGKDPDDVIRDNPSTWLTLVDGALPTIDFLLNATHTRFNLGDPKGKAQAVKQIMPVIAEITDPVIRAHYIQKLARLVNVDEKVLQSSSPVVAGQRDGRQPPVRRPASAATPTVNPQSAPATRDRIEAHCLALLIQHPDLGDGTVELDGAQFSDADYRCIFEAWRATPGMKDMVDRLDDNLREEVAVLASQKLPSADKIRRREELVSILRTLEERRLKRMAKENVTRLRDAEAE